MIRFSKLYLYDDTYVLNETYGLNTSTDEIRQRGNILIKKAEDSLNPSCINKLFGNKKGISKAIFAYAKAGNEYKSINELNLCINAYEKALEQCMKFDKFKSVKTIGVLIVYISICNNSKIFINNKYIEQFENYALKTLEKEKKYIKIGYIFKLLAKNFGTSDLALIYYEKSNKFYRKTKVKYAIEENNMAIQKIGEELGKNHIWH